ncbi:MAG: hypothetical protein J7K77_02845 [Dehalococcoidales bacterium]|nr:hypothetical protein [Dehalococcoidales bacterium]
MNKKIIGLVIATVTLAGLVGTGTWAYFSDTEQSTNNSLCTGTLDLTIDGGNSPVTTFSETDVAPGDHDSGSNILANEGTLDGELDIEFSAITNTGGTTEEYGDGSGDLGGVAEIAAYMDVDQSSSWTAGDIGLRSNGTTYSHPTTLNYDIINNYDSQSWDAVETMVASAADNFVILWRVPTSAGNEIQGDCVSFDVTFILEQAEVDGGYKKSPTLPQEPPVSPIQ